MSDAQDDDITAGNVCGLAVFEPLLGLIVRLPKQEKEETLASLSKRSGKGKAAAEKHKDSCHKINRQRV